MATVWIPSLLRSLTGGQESLQVPGATVRQIVDNLEKQFPGIKARLCDGDELRRGIAVAVNAQVAQAGLAAQVPENSEVHFVPAISGGSIPATFPPPRTPRVAGRCAGRWRAGQPGAHGRPGDA